MWVSFDYTPSRSFFPLLFTQRDVLPPSAPLSAPPLLLRDVSAAGSPASVRVFHVRHELHGVVLLLRRLDPPGRRERADDRMLASELHFLPVRELPTETRKKESERESNPRPAAENSNQNHERRAHAAALLHGFHAAVSHQLHFLLPNPEHSPVLLPDRHFG